jgi:hypothetical protein
MVLDAVEVGDFIKKSEECTKHIGLNQNIIEYLASLILAMFCLMDNHRNKLGLVIIT